MPGRLTPPAIWVIKRGCCRCIGISPWLSPTSSQPMEVSSRFSHTIGPGVLIAVAIAFGLTIATKHTEAHTPVTSKYDYNRDVFPLLRDHCASCHVPCGPAPMSLIADKDAMTWAQSIADALTCGPMTPWPAHR